MVSSGARVPHIYESIWFAVQEIPAGSVATYGDIAAAARASNPRHVAQALKAAPPGLGLPWHRVVAAGGRIALPGDAGVEQRVRLEAEGVSFGGKRVRIEIHRAKLTEPRP